MARSRKKAFVKAKDRDFQKYGHSALRRKVRMKLSQNDWETMPVMDEMVNSWTVIDIVYDLADWVDRLDRDSDARTKYITDYNMKKINGNWMIPK